jgi:hypothetical protein
MLPSSPGILLAGLLARSRVMPPSPFTRRLEILEEKVERLERLPDRIDNLEVQILQFREEVRAEFSATRESLGGQMGALERLAARIDAVDERLTARIAEGDEETRRFMRVLHEDLVARIATMSEGGRHRE